MDLEDLGFIHLPQSGAGHAGSNTTPFPMLGLNRYGLKDTASRLTYVGTNVGPPQNITCIQIKERQVSAPITDHGGAGVTQGQRVSARI